MRILSLPDRELPKNSIFEEEYRNNSYILDKYHVDFIYYETTNINNIYFDDRHSLPWDFFSVDGLNYFLPRILFLIQNEIEELSVSLSDLLINMTLNNKIILLFDILKPNEIRLLRSVIESILFDTTERGVSSIGEHYLFLDLEFIDDKLNQVCK